MFSCQTIWQIGIQITSLLEDLHKIGYIYNDLKPHNVCVGNYSDDQENHELHKLKLIDFGLVTKYLDENG